MTRKSIAGLLILAALTPIAAAQGNRKPFPQQPQPPEEDRGGNGPGGGTNAMLQQLIDGQSGFYKLEVPGIADARAIGIWGECDLGRISEADCAFSVDTVRYNPLRTDRMTKFNAVCLDQAVAPQDERVLNCSSMKRDVAGFGFDLSASIGAAAEGGVAAGVNATLGAHGSAGLAVGVSFPIRRKISVPMRRINRSFGGNVLLDSQIGSVVAERYVIFGHGQFDGSVTFLGSKPEPMEMTVGYAAPDGTVTCSNSVGTVSCPVEFQEALLSVCGLRKAGECSASNPFAKADDDEDDSFSLEPIIDPQEIRAILEARRDEAENLRSVAREKILERASSEFRALLDDLEDGGLSAQVRSKLRARLASIQEHVGLVVVDTGRPEYTTKFARLDNLDRTLSGVQGTLNNQIVKVGKNQKNICDSILTCILSNLF